MAYVTLAVELTLRGPLITQSTSPGTYGLDAAMARDPEGRIYLPGTHLSGKLREAWEQIAGIALGSAGPELTRDRIDDWLGRESGPGGVEPARKRLVILDLYPADGVPADSARRYRVALDPQRGAVNDQALQAIEAPYAAGAEVSFFGKAHFLARDAEEAQAMQRALQVGLNWIGQIGAERTLGFGRLLAAKVGDPQAKPPAQQDTPGGDCPALDLALSPEAPLCLARHSPVGNLFESLETIPGGAIKGLIAAHWTALLGRPVPRVDADLDPERPELGAWFHALRFTHAFPSAVPGVRPIAWPDSLVKVGKVQGAVDLALTPGPVLLRDELDQWRAPAFRIDWKDDSDVAESFGWPRLTRELRVRTQIDGSTRRAKDEQLFAYEMLWPRDLTGASGAPPIAWYGRVDLSRVPDAQRRPVATQLVSLTGAGLLGLGKTKAPVTVTLSLPGLFRPACQDWVAGPDGPWLLTLQTPALLCDPATLNEASGIGELRDAYACAWADLSGGLLRLERYLARQGLAGGTYLHRRFGGAAGYNPYLLTEPGALFVLAPAPGRGPEAAALVAQWLATGLPLPGWARTRYGGTWGTCPYLPENGYGEVAANLGCHRELAPAKTHPLPWEA